MFINKKLVNFSLLFFGYISYCGLNSSPAQSAEIYPGVFVMDTKSKWKIEIRDDSPDERFGYVVCNGGYLGSPLIANEKKIVDRYLAKCTTGKRLEAYAKLPIIDLSSNYDETKIKYLAYKAEINGRNYYLCKGYLNSTNWCSAESQEKSQDLLTRLEDGEDISQDIQDMASSHQRGRNLVSHRNARSSPNSASINNNSQSPSLNSLITKKAIKITQEELEALKTGEIKLEDLLSERENVDLTNVNVANENEIAQNDYEVTNRPVQKMQRTSKRQIRNILLPEEEENNSYANNSYSQNTNAEAESESNYNILTDSTPVKVQVLPPIQRQIQQQEVAPQIQTQAQPIQQIQPSGNFNIQQLQPQAISVQPNYATAQQPLPLNTEEVQTIPISQNDYMALQNGSLSPQQLVQNYLPAQQPMPQMQPSANFNTQQPMYQAPVQSMPLNNEEVQTIPISQNDYMALQNGSLSPQQLVQNYLPAQQPMPQMQQASPIQVNASNYNNYYAPPMPMPAQYNASGIYY